MNRSRNARLARRMTVVCLLVAASMAASVTAASAAAVQYSSITIKASASTARIGSVVVLSGNLTSPDTVGHNIVVFVKKPGQSRFSYSSARTVYLANYLPAWLYKYRFKPGMAKGLYCFKASTLPIGFLMESSSREVFVRLR